MRKGGQPHAIGEDGSAASFAGQYETYLNVTGVEAIAEAITNCWASARSERVMEYRKRYGFSQDEARVAVLVQHLVPADVSAVVFSANPVNGSREEAVINASWGWVKVLWAGPSPRIPTSCARPTGL